MIHNVQALRGLAAFLVVVAHVGDVFGIKAFGFGVGGVDVFFVISGFVMAHCAANRPTGAAEFMARRIARIAPLYWLLTLALFVSVLIAPGLAKGTDASFVDLTRSLLFIPFEKPSGAMQPLLFVGWTLNYEMAFYALFALTAAISPKGRGPVTCAVLLAAIVAIGLMVKPGAAVIGFYTDPIVLEFALGIGLAYAFQRGYVLPVPIAAAVLLAGFVALAVCPAMSPDGERLLTAGLPAVAIVAAALSLERRGLAARNGVVVALGDASYSLYLSHPFTLAATGLIAGKLAIPTAIAIPGAVLMAMVAGIVVYRCVERPLGRLTKRALLKRFHHIGHTATVGAAEYETIIVSSGAR